MLLERITARVAELTGQVEQLRKQLADTEHELDRLVVAEQVVTPRPTPTRPDQHEHPQPHPHQTLTCGFKSGRFH